MDQILSFKIKNKILYFKKQIKQYKIKNSFLIILKFGISNFDVFLNESHIRKPAPSD